MQNNLIAAIAIGCVALSTSLNTYGQTITREARLTWTAPVTCESGSSIANCPITGYSIERRIANVWTQVGSTAANVLTFTERNLAIGTHTYRVIANSDAGPSQPSSEVSKTIDVPGAPGNIVITITVTIAP